MVNDQMRRILDIPAVSKRVATAKLLSGLADLAHSQVVEIGGCFFLKDLVPHDFDLDRALANSFDRTDLETSFHIHVEDNIGRRYKSDGVYVLAQGILYACELFRNLATKGHFRVYLSFTSPYFTLDPFGEPENFTSCTVRFHAVRPDERAWSNLGGTDPMLILDSSMEEDELWVR